jgi:putative ABC transport system substrate-binding protein
MNRNRIALMVVLAFGILIAPLAADAQEPGKTPRIGALSPSRPPPCRIDSFAQGLRELGYVEGENIVLEWRCAGGTAERARELAVELVQLPVDVLVAGASAGPLAAKQATSTIPIVFVAAGDPVANGLVASLARPGGNVTGLADTIVFGAEFHAKRLQLLLDSVPGATRIAALRYRPAPLRVVEEAGRLLGVHLQVLEVETPEELEGAFAAMAREGAQALLMGHAPFFFMHRARLLELAAQHRLPGVYQGRSFVEAGGLMAYNASYDALWRRAAYYVDRILKGTKPAELPVELPMHFELMINLKTAQALGLTIPPSLLLQATEVIQ